MQQQTNSSAILGQRSRFFVKLNLVFWIFVVLVLLVLVFGFGYFLGRFEQIQINKSVLKPIPDVNCSMAAPK